jgi:hypothetical protein
MFGYLVYYIVIVQTAYFVLLTISTCRLFDKLKQLENSQINLSFKEEKRDILRTVIGFDVIYSLRIVLGFTMIPWMYSGQAFKGSEFINLEFSISSCTLLDLTPIVLVMLLHRKNFQRQTTVR